MSIMTPMVRHDQNARFVRAVLGVRPHVHDASKSCHLPGKAQLAGISVPALSAFRSYANWVLLSGEPFKNCPNAWANSCVIKMIKKNCRASRVLLSRVVRTLRMCCQDSPVNAVVLYLSRIDPVICWWRQPNGSFFHLHPCLDTSSSLRAARTSPVLPPMRRQWAVRAHKSTQFRY